MKKILFLCVVSASFVLLGVGCNQTKIPVENSVPIDTTSIQEQISIPTTTPSIVLPVLQNEKKDEKIISEDLTDGDSDGLTDSREKELGTDPQKMDTDGDEMPDGDEVLIWKTNPLSSDTDNDGYLDVDEIGNWYNPSGSGKLIHPEIVFADNLGSCTKYKVTFRHLFTGKLMEKEILGVIDGKCNYIEQMPNNGKMECKYSESERVVVAQYYKDINSAESFGTDVKIDLVSGEKKTTYMINGKLAENPLQEVIDNGTCVISGY